MPTPDSERDRFSGELFVVLLDDKDHPSLSKDGRSLWALAQPLAYFPGDYSYKITIPKGFVTDLTSIPRWGWTLLPPDGPWTKAAVVHDYLYATTGTGLWHKHPASITRPTPYTRLEADNILREAMLSRGVDQFRSSIIYWAVRLGGGQYWNSGGGDRSAAAAVAESVIADELK